MKLLKEFRNLQKIPIFTIYDKNEKIEDYYILKADEKGIWTEGELLYHIKWDEFNSLKENLEELFYKIITKQGI